MEERIVMKEGDVDDYTHPPGDETRREVIYQDDHIKVAVLDDPGQGGACHVYETYENSGTYRGHTRTRFQNGSIQEFGVNGTTNEAELAKIQHRLEGFMAGPFPHPKTAKALDHVKKALACLQERTDERKARGVEGKTVA